jgi:peptide/nickel transport system substrate-binding protein
VHLGPYRLADFGLAENMVFERFDDYYLGRPKLNTIIVRAIGDDNSLIANLRSGTLDIVTENAVPEELTAELREEWKRTGEGTVLHRQANLPYILVQFNPEWVRPPELARDPRIRRGLLFGLDRDAIREVALPGFPDTQATSYLQQSDPRSSVVGAPFARYRYDPIRATQELADAGWRRGADGRVVDQSGATVQLPVRAGAGDDRELAIIAQSWRDLGLDVAEELAPAALARDVEYNAKFPGLMRTARGVGPTIFVRVDGRAHPTPQNRYSGTATGSYANPALDRLIDRLYATISEKDQGLLLQEMGDILANELPLMPLYFAVKMAAVGKGVRALADDFQGAEGPGLVAANAYLWARE